MKSYTSFQRLLCIKIRRIMSAKIQTEINCMANILGMKPETPLLFPTYGTRKRRPISFKKVEGGILFQYIDGTTKFHPDPPPLATFLPVDKKAG